MSKRKPKANEEPQSKKSKVENGEPKEKKEEESKEEESEESQESLGQKLRESKGGLKEALTFKFRPQKVHRSIKGISHPIKIEYFPLQALCEVIKLILEETQTAYDCMVWNGDDYTEQRKKTTPFGAVPVARLGHSAFQNTDGVLAQSGAIVRYLGAKLGLDGKTPEERASVDMIFEMSRDVKDDLKYLHDEDKSSWGYTKLARELQMAQAILEKSEHGYPHHLNKLTYADLAFFQALTQLETSKPGALVKEFKCDKLAKYRENIASRPNIAAYLQSPRRIPFTYKELQLPGWQKRLFNGYEYYFGKEAEADK